MDDHPALVITKELASGETLLWAGRPQQGVLFRRSDLLLVPFALLWCGFAIFWETAVISSRAPILFRLWGIPFVVIGLYMVFGRFFAEAKQRERTYYGLTDRNIIIVSGWFNRQVKRINLKTISDVSLEERGERRGTITFGPALPFQAWFGASGWPGMGRTATPSFEMIENARSVYELITTTQRNA